MTDEEFYQEVKSVVSERINSDKQIKAYFEKAAKGKATIRETIKANSHIANIIGTTLSDFVTDDKIGKGLMEYVCKEILKEQHLDTFKMLEQIQKAIDENLGIKLTIKKPEFPAERVTIAAHSLEDTTVDISVIQRRAKSVPENIINSYADDFVKENAKLRNDAGLKCYITRYTSGHCCEWCNNLAGKYEYGSEPSEVYHRHDNCDCVVTYESGRKRQDVWSKKSWEAPETDKSEYKPEVLDYERAKAVEAQNMRFKGVDKSGESGIIKITKTNVKLDKTLSTLEESDRQSITDLLSKSSDNIISAVNACDGWFEIDPNFPKSERGSHYVWNEQKVNVFLPDINVDMYSDVRGKEELFKPAYNELFHEMGHAIDNAAGRNAEGGFWASKLSSTFLSPSKKITLGDSLEFEVQKAIKSFGEEELSKMLEDMPLIQSADVSDIFGAFTENKVVGYTGHNSSYWANDRKEKAASEAFAEMFSAEINNPYALNSFKSFFPDSYAIFKEILSAIPEIKMKR